MSNIDYTSQAAYRSGIFTTNGGNVLPNVNTSRRTIIIQNLSTSTLYVYLGAGASTTQFDFILKGGLAQDDGNGGMFSEDVLSYTGVVSVAGASAVRCTASAF